MCSGPIHLLSDADTGTGHKIDEQANIQMIICNSQSKLCEGLRANLFGNLLPIHAELKTLELDHEHVWGFVDGDTFCRPDQAALPGALVLVLPLQIFDGCEALESLFQCAGPVYLQADVQERIYGVALKATFYALHLQMHEPNRNSPSHKQGVLGTLFWLPT